MQIEGIFDLPTTRQSETAWDVNLPTEDRPWNVGLIVGPSGSGKSTLAEAFFASQLVKDIDWPVDLAIVDAFPSLLTIKEIASLLHAVGFSTPRAWLRPFRCLSAGEQFRATLAQALAGPADCIVLDEFASYVDPVTAKVASTSFSKAIRSSNRRCIAITSRDDLLDWLAPEWIYRTDPAHFCWRPFQPRPSLDLLIRRAHRQCWEAFQPHHYLSDSLHPSAICFVGEVWNRPATFCAVLPAPHPRRPGWREHRIVCLPMFQGVGLGSATSDFVASLFASRARPYRSTTSSPNLIRHRIHSPDWRMTRPPGFAHRQTLKRMIRTSSRRRLTASFEYVGQPRTEDAATLGIARKSQAR